jgi:hypothetical protein
MHTRATIVRALVSIAFAGTGGLAGCGAPANSAPGDRDIDATAAELASPGGASIEADAAFGACPGAYPSCFTCGPSACGQPCCAHETEPGFEFWYVDDCTAWATPLWQRKSAPGLVCHLDLDQHWNKVTIEIKVAEPYEDIGCAHQPDHWLKYKKSETSCSFFTGSGECQSRVEEKVGALAAQGYIPIVADVDDDQCPHPRLEGGVIVGDPGGGGGSGGSPGGGGELGPCDPGGDGNCSAGFDCHCAESFCTPIGQLCP